MKFEFLSKTKKTVISVVTVVVVAGLCFGFGILWANRSAAVPVITTDLLSERLVSINELSTVKYGYTNMGKFEKTNDFYGWNVPFTTKSFIISYDGEIKAGVDLSKCVIDIKGNKIKVKLPGARILSHVIDEESIEVFDETKNIFNQISITDYKQFSIDQKEKMEEKVISRGILTEATEKAEVVIENIINLSKDKNDDYTVEFIK